MKRAHGSRDLGAAQIYSFVASVLGPDLHARRILSLSNATVGTIYGSSLAVSAMGRALAQSEGLDAKHAIKQVDRLLSNQGIDVWRLFDLWVPYVLGGRREIVVALDWTEFDADDQSTIALHLVTSHGRATPLIWKTVRKSKLKGWRNAHEDDVLARLHDVIDEDVDVAVLADRGFGDGKLYDFLKDNLEMGHIIRFRGSIQVTNSKGESRPAKDWLIAGGRARLIANVTVTANKVPVEAFVCVHARGMKEPWFLAVHGRMAKKTAAAIVKMYGRRFTIEEGFRDVKDLRFGMGLSASRVRQPNRRDRLLLIGALGIALLTMLGAAGEQLGFDRMLRANTSKRRTHSLFFQGRYYYGAIPNMRDDKLRVLVEKFSEMMMMHQVFCAVFAVI